MVGRKSPLKPVDGRIPADAALPWLNTRGNKFRSSRWMTDNAFDDPGVAAPGSPAIDDVVFIPVADNGAVFLPSDANEGRFVVGIFPFRGGGDEAILILDGAAPGREVEVARAVPTRRVFAAPMRPAARNGHPIPGLGRKQDAPAFPIRRPRARNGFRSPVGWVQSPNELVPGYFM